MAQLQLSPSVLCIPSLSYASTLYIRSKSTLLCKCFSMKHNLNLTLMSKTSFIILNTVKSLLKGEPVGNALLKPAEQSILHHLWLSIWSLCRLDMDQALQHLQCTEIMHYQRTKDRVREGEEEHRIQLTNGVVSPHPSFYLLPFSFLLYHDLPLLLFIRL